MESKTTSAKEEGRLEGPFTYGEEPLNWNVKGNRQRSIEEQATYGYPYPCTGGQKDS